MQTGKETKIKDQDIYNSISDPYKFLWYALVSCGDK